MADKYGHVTRLSDSSVYDEVCTLCGATDARGSDRLQKPCPQAKREPPKLHVSGSSSTSTAPPADGWHITISRQGVPSVMLVEGGSASIWHDFETGMREWAGVAAPEPGKEVMPNDENSIDARSATSPGVTAGAVEALVKAAEYTDDFMRTDKAYERSGAGTKLRAALAAIREGRKDG